MNEQIRNKNAQQLSQAFRLAIYYTITTLFSKSTYIESIVGLITQRSEVRILPPLHSKALISCRKLRLFLFTFSFVCFRLIIFRLLYYCYTDSHMTFHIPHISNLPICINKINKSEIISYHI